MSKSTNPDLLMGGIGSKNMKTERETKNILATFIPDIGKKQMESYKADAKYTVEWVKSGKNPIVYV